LASSAFGEEPSVIGSGRPGTAGAAGDGDDGAALRLAAARAADQYDPLAS
jgi:hypothetical protein